MERNYFDGLATLLTNARQLADVQDAYVQGRECIAGLSESECSYLLSSVEAAQVDLCGYTRLIAHLHQSLDAKAPLAHYMDEREARLVLVSLAHMVADFGAQLPELHDVLLSERIRREYEAAGKVPKRGKSA